MFNIFSGIVEKENIFLDESMKKHTTFRIGGNAECFIKCCCNEHALNVARVCKEKNIPLFVMGNGSNILVSDDGISGVVLQLDSNFNKIDVDIKERIITAESGIHLSKLAVFACKNSLGGLECLSGIPGTLGGAIYMNAGAYGDEIGNHIRSVTFIDEDFSIKTFNRAQCEFGYRRSAFTDKNRIILSAILELNYDDADNIKSKMMEFTERRNTKQPVEKFSAGSTFKRPEGNFAGTLIENCGLKGKTIGGAQVSEKHAGFIINTGCATSDDVLNLIEYIQKKVYDYSGVFLEPEVKFIGDYGTNKLK